MARLDKFIQVMRDQRAQSLHLSVGQPVALMVSGAARPITRDALAGRQILGLIREIAPAGMAGGLESGGPDFTYETAGRTTHVALTVTPAGLAAVLRPGEPVPSGAAAPATAILPEPVSVAPPTLRSAVVTENSGASAAIDRLLRILSDSGASDLHLRTGEPPIVRRDGSLTRLEEPKITAEAMKAMLASIMPVKDYTEFRKR